MRSLNYSDSCGFYDHCRLRICFVLMNQCEWHTAQKYLCYFPIWESNAISSNSRRQSLKGLPTPAQSKSPQADSTAIHQRHLAHRLPKKHWTEVKLQPFTGTDRSYWLSPVSGGFATQQHTTAAAPVFTSQQELPTCRNSSAGHTVEYSFPSTATTTSILIFRSRFSS